MFEESLTGSPRQRAHHTRQDSTGLARQLHYDRPSREGAPPPSGLNPFVIGEDGRLRVIATPTTNTAAATLNTSTSRSRGLDQTPTRNDPHPQDTHYESPPKGSQSLKHAKFPFRDARATKRGSFTDRLSQHIHPDDIEDASPSRLRKVTSGLEGRDTDYRSTIFHDIDTLAGRTPAPVEDESSSTRSQGEEATNQRIAHRQTRQAVSAPLLVAAKKGLQESSLPRSSRDKTSSRKRRLSLDYDDAALHSMSYSDLHNEAFDHDPTRVAVQAATEPSGQSLEDRLVHYKDKDENGQHHFFTEISVPEWEACGDWFLEQFSEVVQKMKTRRQNKRKMVAAFESEIAAREKTVRVKVEMIDRTLGDLKREGDQMMQGRDRDL
jgi:hypothetical protein